VHIIFFFFPVLLGYCFLCMIMISEHTRKSVFGNLVNKIDGTLCLFALLFSNKLCVMLKLWTADYLETG